MISRSGIVNADGALQYDMEGSACYEDLRDYESVQYAYLFDN